jgi:hypothetical protein
VTSGWRSFLKECLGFLLHFPVATIGGALAAFIIVALLWPVYVIFGARVGVLFNIYDPLLLLPAGALGFLINRRTNHRSACAVGALGAVLILLVMRSDASLYARSNYYHNLQGHYWRYEFEQLFSPEDRSCNPEECLGKYLFTLPFFSSVAYSIGAWLGLRSHKLGDVPHLQSST